MQAPNLNASEQGSAEPFCGESNKTECLIQAGHFWPADGVLSS